MKTILQLSGVERRFKMPFPLAGVGFMTHPECEATSQRKLELCIRLSSESATTYDRFDDLEYVCRFPNVCVKTPDMVHHLKFDCPRDAVYFGYKTELALGMKHAGLCEPPYCWEFTMTPEINRLLREVRDLLPHSLEFGVADQLDIYAMLIWEKLLLMRDERETSLDFTPGKIRRIASYLNLNFMREIDLEELIRKNGFSRRNFFRSWQKEFQIPPAAYIRQLKLHESRRLLEETSLSISEITERLHLSTSSYFCLIFKKQFGVTPYQYRKEKTKS